MALRGPHRRVSVSEQKANWSGGCGMSQSLAMRPARDSVTLARVREIVEQLAARDRSGEVVTAAHHIPAPEARVFPVPPWLPAGPFHPPHPQGPHQPSPASAQTSDPAPP